MLDWADYLKISRYTKLIKEIHLVQIVLSLLIFYCSFLYDPNAQSSGLSAAFACYKSLLSRAR